MRKLLAGLFLILVSSAHGVGAPLYFIYETTADLSESPLSGAVNAPVMVSFSYDPSQSPTSTNNIPGVFTLVGYGGLSGTATLGALTLPFSNLTFVVLKDDGGIGIDRYGLSIQSSSFQNVPPGLTIDFFFINIDVASGLIPDLSLPSAALLIALNAVATFHGLEIDVTEGSSITIYASSAPGFISTPLPAALPLFVTGLAGLGWLARRRQKPEGRISAA